MGGSIAATAKDSDANAATGGGFSSFSKAYGTAACSLLEAEIVTADGQTRIVNRAREPDLFWALKGGGGGTFGVVTRVTLATHELPTTFGTVTLDLHALSDEAFRRLLAASLTSMRPISAIRIGASRCSRGPTIGCKSAWFSRA
jgi:FAD/FMN-containing dehydrogenase